MLQWGPPKCWRCQNHETAIKENCIQGREPAQGEVYITGGAELPKPFKTRAADPTYGATGFGVHSVGFLSCFMAVFTHCAPTLSFWNGNVYCMLGTRNFSLIVQGFTVKRLP